MKLFLFAISFLFLAGCSSIESAAKSAGSDPSQLLYLYAVMNCTIAVLLAWLSGFTIFISILQSVRISGAICAVASPLLWVMYETPKAAIGVGVTGVLALAIITVAFRKDLYPNGQPVAPRPRKKD